MRKTGYGFLCRQKALTWKILEVLMASPNIPVSSVDLVAIFCDYSNARCQVWVAIRRLKKNGWIEQVPIQGLPKNKGVAWRITSSGLTYATSKGINAESFA
jgi:hypothetical protein